MPPPLRHSPENSSSVCQEPSCSPLCTSHCDGKSARMRISGLLDNAAAITSFGPPLEPLQRILYVSLERLATKFFEHPTPPTWRESKVSAILHATGGGVDSCAGDGCMVDEAQWKRDMQLDLMLFRIHHLYPKSHIPLPAQRRSFRIEHLPRRGFPLRHDALRRHMHPFICVSLQTRISCTNDGLSAVGHL